MVLAAAVSLRSTMDREAGLFREVLLRERRTRGERGEDRMKEDTDRVPKGNILGGRVFPNRRGRAR